MKPLLIYTPQNGEYFQMVLNAVATLLKSATFQSGIEIMVCIAVCMVGYQYVMGKKLEALTRYIVLSFIVTYGLFGIKVPVAIIDMQTAEGAGSALTVDNVPLGLALPANIISGIGYGLTMAFSDVFHMPNNDLDYLKTGLIFGSRTWLAASQARLTFSPDLSADVSSYLRQCVFAAKLLGSHQISPQELVHSDTLIKTYFDNPSPIYRVILHDGQNLSCGDAASNIRLRLVTAAQLELARLGRVMTKGDAKKFGNILEAEHHYFINISTSAAETLTQNILINATRDAARDAFAFSGADAALMNYTNSVSQQKMHIAEANTFWLASYRLPYFMTIMLMITICIFPLVLLLSFLPLTQNIYVYYLQSQAYLWSWPPMFVMIHFLVSLAGESKIGLFGEKVGGVTFSNIDALAAQHSAFAYTAGALAASVPFLAYYITKGLSSVLSHASQHFGGIAQSLSVSEAQSVAPGNVSMATYSGWNMNYENTNAHKFDTNRYHAEGRSTMQMANGSLLSQNADGSHVGNIQPAISSASVSVHGSSRVIDSLHQSANESFGHSTQLRSAAESHLQTGLSQMKQFTENDSNDYRSGEGVSNTTNASIARDLRIMKDAIHHHNEHSDNSQQISAEAAITGRLNSQHSIPGKVLGLFTGASVEASSTGRASAAHHHSTQEFKNTSDGKAFNEAYHHMLATVKNNHLDTADTHNLGVASQIAANFAKGESLLEQSSAEYAHGKQLQNAASHATEDAKAIDDNLNQAYHDWVVDRYGAKGEQVMLQADSGSIATQHQWANEFLHSNVGKTAIGSEVSAALSHTKQGLLHDYERDKAALSTSHPIEAQYKKESDIVDKKATEKGFQPMTDAHLAEAQVVQAESRLKQTTNEGHITEKYVNNQIKTTEIKNKEK